MRHLLTNSRGLSLIEVIVSAAIMTIVMMAAGSMLGAQYKESQALTEKLAALDLEKALITSLADGKICQFQFVNKIGVANNVFDASQITPTNFASLDISAIIAAPSPAAASLVMLQSLMPPKTQLSPMTPNLQAKKIQLTNIRSGGAPDSWLAEFSVTFDDKKLVRQLRSLSIRTVLQTTGPTAAKLITGCVGSGVALSSGTGTGGTSMAPTTGLCIPSTPLYEGKTKNCNYRQVDITPDINGCPAVYLGTLCKTQ